MVEKQQKPKQIEISGNLSIGNPLAPIPITIHLGRSVELILEQFLKKPEKDNIETKVISCKGANSQLDEVTVLVTFRGDMPEVRCPRLQKDLKYIWGDYGEKEYHKEMCYCGDSSQKIPVVKEEEFAVNKIFECPYARFKD